MQLQVIEPTRSDRSKIADELRRLHVGAVRFGDHDRLLYSTDASLYQVEPIGVVTPESIDQIAPLVTYCRDNRIALLPRGGGTSLAGQCTNHAVVVDLSAGCRRILEIDEANRTCVVEPGIGIDEFNRHLASRQIKLFFAPDPATSNQAAIGGCIGNNAAGARSIRYGRTSENVLGVDVLLSTGERCWLEPGAGRRSPVALRLARAVAKVVRDKADEIRARFPKLIRRNAGYGLDLVLRQLDAGVSEEDLDLSGLICGSEGTLAIVAGAKLKLEPTPIARGLAVVTFDSVDAAIDAVVPILETQPSAVELLDDVVIRAALGNNECRRYVEMLPKTDGQTPGAVLYVEYQRERDEQSLSDFFQALRQVVPGAAMATFEGTLEMNNAWSLRKASEALLHGLPGHAKPITFVEDNSVPVENLRKFVTEFKHIVARHNTEAAYYAHASVGVLHVRPMIDLHHAEDRAKMQTIAIEVAQLARECGGVMSGEHGDGRVRGPLLAEFYGPVITEAFRQIKAIFDPPGILNPGNIVNAGPVESITQNLRVDANSATVDLSAVDTYFEYAGEDGFNHAVELCNGAGFCRKTAVGVMCPSYRATLDERHSTRGRANAVRVALTGQQADGAKRDTPDFDNADVFETLNLCLSCKACKTECPTNVDIAQLKAEYYAQHQRKHGASLQAKIIGHVRKLNRVASIAPGIANFVSALPPVRAITNKVMNLHPKRSMPKFSKSLYRWFAKRKLPGTKRPRVALWPDCFMTYSEPNIGIAGALALEALGYEVILPKGGCCGRPLMSTGLLEGAIRTADHTLSVLRNVIEDESVVAIIVFEPSCLSAIQDEWLKLKLQTDMELRQRLADKSFLIEQFVERYWDSHPTPPAITPMLRDIVLHGHCHQKALWGEADTIAMLNRIAPGKVTPLPSTCCGMAGAFGYTKDRYDVSMQIGELSVFKPVRAAPDDALIVAPGTSCRHQIHDGTQRHGLHPAEVLAMALGCVAPK